MAEFEIHEGPVGYMVPSKFEGGGFRIAIKGVDGFLTLPANLAEGVTKGTPIKVKAVQKGRSTYVQALKITGEAKPQYSGGGGGGYKAKGGGGNGMSKEDWEAKDNAIRYQASRNAAIEVLKILKDLDLLKLGSKAAEKENILMMKLDTITASFYEDIGTLGAVSRVTSQTEETSDFDPEGEDDFPTEVPGEFPEDDDDF